MGRPDSARAPAKRTLMVIPASLTSDTPHLREKTYRIGMVGRAAAIFRVDEIVIYPDLTTDQARDAELIRLILSYMETPQYLRRRLFRIVRELRYVGILPPLRTPHHLPRAEGLRVGEFREGLVVRVTGKGSLVDVGVDRPVLVPLRRPLLERVTVKITRAGGRPTGSIVGRDDVPYYWGYSVRVARLPLGELVRREMGDLLIVSTSRYGRVITDLLDEMRSALSRSRGVAVLFGSPREGLFEILYREGASPADISDFTVNVVPHQGTRTVRTEEAIYAFFSIFNALVR